MTIIVGMVCDGVAWLAADRQVGNSQGAKYVKASPKLFRRGGLIVGVSGDLVHQDLLECFDGWPTRAETFAETMRRESIPALIEAAERRRLVQLENGVLNLGMSALIGHGGKLYHLDSRGALREESRTYAATGSGGWEALGALFVVTKRPQFMSDPTSALPFALRAACTFDDGCGPPFDVWSERGYCETLES